MILRGTAARTLHLTARPSLRFPVRALAAAAAGEPRPAAAAAAAAAAPPSSVFELARGPPPASAAFRRLISLRVFTPEARGTPALREKYGTPLEDRQTVVAVAAAAPAHVCFFNAARANKPQNFRAAGGEAVVDPTAGRGCDFCDPEALTAADMWGRVVGAHSLSASNLFKYGGPAQGLVILRRHDPLDWGLAEVCDVLDVAAGWFERATAACSAAAGGGALHPLLVWNCLGRAGASQFHGHAQVLLSGVELPAQAAERAAAAAHRAAHPAAPPLHADAAAAHAAVGLARACSGEGGAVHSRPGEADVLRLLRKGGADAAVAYPALCPAKDSEIVVYGPGGLRSRAFQRLFTAALRALVDGRGARAFNAGVWPLPGGGAGGMGGPVVGRVVGRGKLSSAASDFGGLELFGGASIGHADPFDVAAALDGALAALPPPGKV